jgi:2-phosphoglycerate kinase
VHFHVRDAASEGVRAVAKYMDRFDDIRRIHDALVARAERHGIPVVESGDIEHAVTETMELVLAAVERSEPVR